MTEALHAPIKASITVTDYGIDPGPKGQSKTVF
jgi:hypothetical protein